MVFLLESRLSLKFDTLSQQHTMMKEAQRFSFQLNVFEQFCEMMSESIYSTQYKCCGLSPTAFSKFGERDKYLSLWNDFVSIRMNLIYGKLYRLFESTLNIPKDKIDKFYKYLTHYRIFCAMLPFNKNTSNVSCNIRESFYKMTREFNETGHDTNKMINIGCLNHFYRFMVIWNGVSIILNNGLTHKIGGILVEKDKGNDRDNNDLMIQLCSLASEFICDQLAQTNVFGNYIISAEDDSKMAEQKKIELNNAKLFQNCKKMVFNDSFDELNQLIRYCTQNISDIASYSVNVIKEKNNFGESGILGFIVNELSYVIFHDLTMNSLNENKDNSEQLLFPKLLKMSKFIYNLSCYLYCYPFKHSSGNETFYISQYFDLRNTLFTDIFDKSNKMSQKSGKLNNYNYFCFSRSSSANGGTLLHGASECSYFEYCRILMKNGFDINQADRHNGKRKTTPYQMAVKDMINRNEPLLILMESFNKREKTANSELTSNTKSIENTARLLLTQIMFAKYYLVCLGINVNDDYNVEIRKHILDGDNNRQVREFVSDELYVKLNDLGSGLSVAHKIKDGKNVINGTLSVVNKLIDAKMIISDDLMILCWVYCNSIDSISSSNKKDAFLNNLLKCVTDCLSDKTKYKLRSYLYFKKFLLHSNIWYCKDNKNDKLLFDYVYQLADKLLTKQKKYIKQSIENEKKQDSEEWYKLCNFNKYNNSDVKLRQDKIFNGIKSIKSIKDVYLIASTISSHDFNLLAEFNDKVYLTQCLTFANGNNEYFQSEMRQLLAEANAAGVVKEAPVKVFDRCLVKSS